MIIAIERKENIDSSAHICDDDSNTSIALNRNSNQHTTNERNDIPKRKEDSQPALLDYRSSAGKSKDWWETSVVGTTDTERK
jgi:hypothetical protein